MKKITQWIGMIILILMASGCAAAADPRRIAFFPAGTSSGPIAVYPVVTYDAWLEIQVGDSSDAADRATEQAANLGGHLLSAQTTYDDWTKVITLVLAVPPARFDDLRRDLYRLGDVRSEHIESVVNEDSWRRQAYSRLTVVFEQSAAASSPSFKLPAATNAWSPFQALRSAFAVSAAVFALLLDVLIWIVVVGGPFVLIVLGVRWLLRHLRRPTS